MFSNIFSILFVFCFAITCNFAISTIEPLSEEFELEEAIVLVVEKQKRESAAISGGTTNDVKEMLNEIVKKLKSIFR